MNDQATETATETTPETPEVEVAPTAAPLSAEAQAIVDYLDNETAKINALPKKSNYHNARRSAFKQVRDLISPPAPKPPKVKKDKKAKAAETAGETSVDVQTGEVTVETSAPEGDTGAA